MSKTKPWAAAVAEAGEVEALEAQLLDAQARLAIYEQIKTTPSHVIPVYKPKPGKSMAVALLSDTHWEERVDPEDVPGTYNIYNPAVARKRAEQFAQRVVLLVEAQRHLVRIDDLCLAVLGDLITGHLHDDNRESNYMPPLKAILFAQDLLNGIIDYLLKHGNFKSIVLPCVAGNHGRLSVKPRAKTMAHTNLEWMLYQLVATKWVNEPRLKFHIAEGIMIYVDLYGHVCRFMHGDHVQYGGGVGGLCVPLLRAVHKLNQTKHADYTMLGHFHQAADFGSVLTNGSMVGFSAYALSKQIPYERPKQQFLLLDSKRGKTLVSDIFCDYTPNEKSQ